MQIEPEEIMIKHMERCADEIEQKCGLEYKPHFISVIALMDGLCTVASLTPNQVTEILTTLAEQHKAKPAVFLRHANDKPKLQS